MKKYLVLNLVFLALCLLGPLQAQTTTVAFESGDYTLRNFYNTVPLALNDIVELGYFSGSNFTGSFTAISGGTITNTALTFTTDQSFTTATTDTVNTVIGGDANTGAGAGKFAYTLVFDLSSVNIPANGQVMSIKFFNSTTVASSTAFGAASNASWLWISPSALGFEANYNLSDPGTVWDANAIGFAGVPEPLTATLLPIGLLLLCVSRRLFQRRP